jgi:menaquinone-dependent protoporphyrinogen IX oxidase
MSMFEQSVLPLYEAYRGDWLSAARRVASEIGSDGRTVTIDDVRRRLPPPSHIDPRVMGAVFVRSQWEKIGYLNSGRATCHKRPIAMFRRREGGGA